MVDIGCIALRLLSFDLLFLQELSIDTLDNLVGDVDAKEHDCRLASVLLLLDFDAHKSLLVENIFLRFHLRSCAALLTDL